MKVIFIEVALIKTRRRHLLWAKTIGTRGRVWMKYRLDKQTQEVLEIYDQSDADGKEFALDLLRAMHASQKTSEYDENALVEYLQMRAAFGDLVAKKTLDSVLRIINLNTDNPYRSYCEQLERRNQGKCTDCGGGSPAEPEPSREICT